MEVKEIAKALSTLTPDRIKELNVMAETHNFRIVPIRIKPDGGGCTPGSCPTGYYCDGQTGQCILNIG
jgi:hypothetical protein